MTAVSDAELTDICNAVWASLLEAGPEPADGLPDSDATIGAEISIGGAWEGTLRLRCSPEAARAVTAEVLMCDASEVDDDMVGDTLGELANIIGGNVKALLPDSCQLGLPTALVPDAGDRVATTQYAWHAGPFHIALDASPVA